MGEWISQLFDPQLGSLTTGSVYAVVWALVLVESGLLVGFLLPGDTVLFTAGLLTASGRTGVSLPLLAGGTALAAVLGDGIGYWSGRRLGRPWVERRAGRAAAHLPRAEAFYERWGWRAVVLARFVPWVRTLAPIVAGVARMSYPRFLAANVVGALLWGSGLIVLGYVAHSVPWVRTAAYAVAGTSVLASLLGPVVARVRRRRRVRSRGADAERESAAPRT